MRVATGRALRVEPGDEVIVQARLATAPLGRLYVFAREGEHGNFSPYVASIPDIASGKPQLQSPLALRLTKGVPARVLRFRTDFNGAVCVMQEVDRFDDPRAQVKLTRKINKELPWMARLSRKLRGMFR